MPRVAAGDPDPVAARQPPGEREQVGRLAPESGPAVSDLGLAGRRARSAKASSCPWMTGGRLVGGRALGLEARVAAPAEDQPAVRQLLPVVVAAARVVRPVVEQLAAARSRAPGRASASRTAGARARARRSSRRRRARPRPHRAGRPRRARRAAARRSPLRRRPRAARAASPRAQARARRRPDGRSRPRRARRSRSGTGSSHSASKPSSRSASYSRRSVSSSAASTASRRLPTRRSASPASSDMRSSVRSVSAQSIWAWSAPRVSRASSYGGQRPRSAKPPLRPLAPAAISRASRSLTRRPRSGERERAGASGDPAADDDRRRRGLTRRRPAPPAAAVRANMKLSSRAAILRSAHHLL